MAYVEYKFKQHETLLDIALRFNVTIDEIMILNNVPPPFPKYVIDLPEYVIGDGFIKVPYRFNGSQSYEDFYIACERSTGIVYESSSSLLSSIMSARTSILPTGGGGGGSGGWDSSYMIPAPCYIILDYNGEKKLWNFPCYPEQVSDSNQASYTPHSLLGSPEPIQVYQHSGPRTVQVSFNMHSDMVYKLSGISGDIDYIYKLTSAIEACCYPKYGESKISAIKVLLRIGENISIQGIISSVNTTYSGPILDTTGNETRSRIQHPKYAMINLSFGVTEVMGANNNGEIPLNYNYVKQHGGNRI